MFVKAVAVSVLAMATMQASAMCLAPKPVALESAYDYDVALAGSLQMTRQARDRAAAALQRGVSDGQSAASLLTMLKTSQSDYACARQYIQGYLQDQRLKSFGHG